MGYAFGDKVEFAIGGETFQGEYARHMENEPAFHVVLLNSEAVAVEGYRLVKTHKTFQDIFEEVTKVAHGCEGASKCSAVDDIREYFDYDDLEEALRKYYEEEG